MLSGTAYVPSGSDVGEAVGDAVGEAVGDTVGEAVGDAVGEAVGDAVGEAVGEAEAVGVGDAELVTLGEGPEFDRLWPAWLARLTLRAGAGATVGEAVGDAVGEAVAVGLGDVERVPLGEGLAAAAQLRRLMLSVAATASTATGARSLVIGCSSRGASIPFVCRSG
jgi:hypothetical protein